MFDQRNSLQKPNGLGNTSEALTPNEPNDVQSRKLAADYAAAHPEASMNASPPDPVSQSPEANMDRWKARPIEQRRGDC